MAFSDPEFLYYCAQYQNGVGIVYYDSNTKNTPNKAGITQSTEGIGLISGSRNFGQVAVMRLLDGIKFLRKKYDLRYNVKVGMINVPQIHSLSVIASPLIAKFTSLPSAVISITWALPSLCDIAIPLIS